MNKYLWIAGTVFVSLFLLNSCKTGTKEAPEVETAQVSSMQTLIIDSMKMDDLLMVPKIHFPTQFSTVHNSIVVEGDAFYSEINDNDKLLIESQLDTTKKQVYTIYFSYGMSLDPHFAIYYKDKFLIGMGGLELTIDGDGKIYSSGHTNTFFNERRLWKVVGDTIVEQLQPFLYSGLKTIALSDFPIFTDTLLQHKVKTIRANDSLEVLLNQGDFYLLKDQNHVVGWWKLDDFMSSKQIKGLYYLGD